MVARKLSEIAAQLGLILQGDDAEVIGVNTLEGAGPDEVSFLANPNTLTSSRQRGLAPS